MSLAMSLLRLLAQLFWWFLWDACFYLLYTPTFKLLRLLHHFCNFCSVMVLKIEAEEVIAVLKKPAKGA